MLTAAIVLFAFQSNLVSGVDKLPTLGSPGLVIPITSAAKAVLVGTDRRRVLPVAVQSTLGNGKVLAFGHTSYLSPQALENGDGRRLFKNAFDWMGTKKLGIVRGQIDPEWARKQGFEPVSIGSDLAGLDGVDTLVLEDTTQVAKLESFVRRGGSIIVAVTPWGWLQLHPGKELASDLGINRVLAQAGVAFADGGAKGVRPVSASDDVPDASTAVDRIVAGRAGPNDADLVINALGALPESSELWRNVKRAVLDSTPTPTMAKPVLSTDARGRLAILVDFRSKSKTPNVAATDFPGQAPKSAPRIAKDVDVRSDVRHWASTGAYANAGEEVTVHVSAEVAKAGWRLQIGVHSDKLWGLDKWQRHPDIVTSAAIVSETTKLTSRFGGLVIVNVTKPVGISQNVRLDGVIGSPRYVLGKTTPEEWKRQLQLQAPWAEFEGEKLILSVPIDEARKVADPEKLMKLWDRTLALYADLDGNGDKPRPERIVCDRQISAGYMHSGYPIMTWMDKSVPLSLDVEKLTTEGTWGHWHELGHNRQKPEWTFSGTGEVTNNIFTLWGMTQIAHQPLMSRLDKNKKEVASYFANGARFEDWKSKPFVALTMYAQLIDAFGWESLKKVFRDYANGPKPQTDLEKHNQWMERYSRIVGRNLGPFFDHWGVPVSAEAKARIASLPSWTPTAP